MKTVGSFLVVELMRQGKATRGMRRSRSSNHGAATNVCSGIPRPFSSGIGEHAIHGASASPHHRSRRTIGGCHPRLTAMSTSPSLRFALASFDEPWNVLAMGSMVALVFVGKGIQWAIFSIQEGGVGGRPMLVVPPGTHQRLLRRARRPNQQPKRPSWKRRRASCRDGDSLGFSLVACGWGAWLSHEMGSAGRWRRLPSNGDALDVFALLKGRDAWGNVAIFLCVGGLML